MQALTLTLMVIVTVPAVTEVRQLVGRQGKEKDIAHFAVQHPPLGVLFNYRNLTYHSRWQRTTRRTRCV